MLEAPTLKAISKTLPLILRTQGQQRLMILIYHRVLERHDYMRPSEPDERQFDWQMRLLSRYLHPLSLSEATRRLADGTLPERAVCVTFDDGYADNLKVALPVLQRWGIPATVYVATGFLDGGRMWNDTVIESVRTIKSEQLDLAAFDLGFFNLADEAARRQSAQQVLVAIKHLDPQQRSDVTRHIASLADELPGDLMLESGQLRELHGSGIEIGAHTHNHPILASLDDDAAVAEIATGKARLEDIINAPVESFAYPNGQPGKDFHPCHRDSLAGLGFNCAVTTQQGVAAADTDPFMLPRFTPWDRQPARFLARLLLNGRNLVV